MDRAWAILVVYMLVLLAAAIVTARRWPRLWIWKWVDAIYYPLGALGVVAFFAVDHNIRLEQLVDEKAQVELEFKSKQNIRPQLDLHPTFPELVKASYNGVQELISRGKACEGGGTIDCVVYSANGHYIAESFDKYKLYTGDDVVETAENQRDYCDRILRVLDVLDKNNVNGGYRNVKDALVAEAANSTDSSEAIKQLSNAIQNDQDKVLSFLDQYKSKSTVKTIMDINRNDSTYLYQMSYFCAHRDPGEQKTIDKLNAWRDEEVHRKARSDEIDRLVDDAKRQFQPTYLQYIAKAAKDGIWPFIIIMALATKFGKACANLNSA